MTNKRPLKDCRVLCTPASFGRSDPSLKPELEAAVKEVVYNPYGRLLTAAELRPLIKDIDGYIAGLDDIDTSVIGQANRLQVIACYGAGYDRVDVAAATARGIVVTNSRGANAAAVAELTVAFILALARRLAQANDAVRRGEWPILNGIGMEGRTVGLVGLGAIGSAVSKRLKGFGCSLLAHDPYLTTDAAEQAGVRLAGLEELLFQADFVSLHAPATDSTRGMVGERFLAKMKQGAFLVNTARGDLIDEEALVKALESGHLQGAALDCLRREPPDKNNPLLGFPQVIVTPHTGAQTDQAVNQMGRMALTNCLAVLRGEKPLCIVNPGVVVSGDRD